MAPPSLQLHHSEILDAICTSGQSFSLLADSDFGSWGVWERVHNLRVWSKVHIFLSSFPLRFRLLSTSQVTLTILRNEKGVLPQALRIRDKKDDLWIRAVLMEKRAWARQHHFVSSQKEFSCIFHIHSSWINALLQEQEPGSWTRVSSSLPDTPWPVSHSKQCSHLKI